MGAAIAIAFSLPAGLPRGSGGIFSDRYGARTVMYWSFIGSLVCTFILSYPATDYTFHGLVQALDGILFKPGRHEKGVVFMSPVEIEAETGRADAGVTLPRHASYRIMHRSQLWVTGGKTPGEYMFSGLPQVADI
jgi:hypothetical protein